MFQIRTTENCLKFMTNLLFWFDKTVLISPVKMSHCFVATRLWVEFLLSKRWQPRRPSDMVAGAESSVMSSPMDMRIHPHWGRSIRQWNTILPLFPSVYNKIISTPPVVRLPTISGPISCSIGQLTESPVLILIFVPNTQNQSRTGLIHEEIGIPT